MNYQNSIGLANACSANFPTSRFQLSHQFDTYSVEVRGEANDADELRELLWCFMLACSYSPGTVTEILGERG